VRAPVNACVHQNRHGKNMEEGQNDQLYVAMLYSYQIGGQHGIEHEVGVGQFGSFGTPGGAGGINDHGSVFGAGGFGGKLRRLVGHQFSQSAHTCDGAGIGGLSGDHNEMLTGFGHFKTGITFLRHGQFRGYPQNTCRLWLRNL
jgi:hypothetical protein